MDGVESEVNGGESAGVAIRSTIMLVRRLGVLEVTCFYVFSAIHAAWTLGGGADRGGAPGVAIRCTIMVFRRLWASRVRCFCNILARNGDLARESCQTSPKGGVGRQEPQAYARN